MDRAQEPEILTAKRLSARPVQNQETRHSFLTIRPDGPGLHSSFFLLLLSWGQTRLTKLQAEPVLSPDSRPANPLSPLYIFWIWMIVDYTPLTGFDV